MEENKIIHNFIFILFFSSEAEMDKLRHIETRLGGTTEMCSEAIMSSEALFETGTIYPYVLYYSVLSICTLTSVHRDSTWGNYRNVLRSHHVLGSPS